MWILAHMCGKNQTCVSCSHYLKLQTLSHIMFLVHKIRNFCPNSFWPICLHNTKIRICLSCEFLLSHSNLSLSAIVMFPCWTWKCSFLWKTFFKSGIKIQNVKQNCISVPKTKFVKQHCFGAQRSKEFKYENQIRIHGRGTVQK